MIKQYVPGRDCYLSIRNGKITYNDYRPDKSEFVFEMYEEADEEADKEADDYEEPKSFWHKGTYNPSRGTFKGTWGRTKEEEIGESSFSITNHRNYKSYES